MSRLEQLQSQEKFKPEKWSKYEILIIDDDYQRIENLIRELRKSGIKTRIAHSISLDGALSILKAAKEDKRLPPRLIFLDHMILPTNEDTEMQPLGDDFLIMFKAIQKTNVKMFGPTRIVIFSNAASSESTMDEFDKIVRNSLPPSIVDRVDPDGKEFTENPQAVINRIKEILREQGLLAS